MPGAAEWQERLPDRGLVRDVALHTLNASVPLCTSLYIFCTSMYRSVPQEASMKERMERGPLRSTSRIFGGTAHDSQAQHPQQAGPQAAGYPPSHGGTATGAAARAPGQTAGATGDTVPGAPGYPPSHGQAPGQPTGQSGGFFSGVSQAVSNLGSEAVELGDRLAASIGLGEARPQV